MLKISKTCSTLLVIMLLTLSGGSSSAFSMSEGGDCTPDCPGDLFGGWQSIQITVGTCVVNVWYSTRFACSTYYDVQIHKVDFVGGSCGAGPDYSVLMAQVTEQLLILNPMNFPPFGPGCEDNWRVTQGACWRKEYIPNVPGVNRSTDGGKVSEDVQGGYHLGPCDESVCCLDLYQVCRVPDGNGGWIRQVTHLTTVPPPGDCPYDPAGLCFPVCGNETR